MEFHMWWVMMYIATGLSSSSMSRTENTMNFLLMSTLVGLLRKPDHVPRVYLLNFWTRDSAPFIPARTISKSERRGGSIEEKSESTVMSLSAYVSVMARSTIASSSGVSPPSMILKSPTRVIMFERKMSAGDSSSRGMGRSNGLIVCSEVSEILKYLPPVASSRYSYSKLEILRSLMFDADVIVI